MAETSVIMENLCVFEFIYKTRMGRCVIRERPFSMFCLRCRLVAAPGHGVHQLSGRIGPLEFSSERNVPEHLADALDREPTMSIDEAFHTAPDFPHTLGTEACRLEILLERQSVQHRRFLAEGVFMCSSR